MTTVVPAMDSFVKRKEMFHTSLRKMLCHRFRVGEAVYPAYQSTWVWTVSSAKEFSST
jgi:hypothetical protein